MGCSSSKVDDLQAVALCRERTQFIKQAVDHRYALASAHVSYVQALSGVGQALQRFLDADAQLPPSSPGLTLPTQRKNAEPVDLTLPKSSPPSHSHHLDHSHSGSHLHIDSGSDAESLSEELSHGSSPSYPEYGIPQYSNSGDVFPWNFPSQTLHYMRSGGGNPSVVYEEKPRSPETETVRWSEPYSNYGMMGYGFLGSPPMGAPPPVHQVPSSGPSTSRSPDRAPPPPSPPKASAWDFFNPFESFDTFYPSYTPKRFSVHSDGGSRDSKEVREEEGIPDLEDESQAEVVKEIHGDQTFVYAKKVQIHPSESGLADGDRETGGGEGEYGKEDDPVEYVVHMVDKGIIDEGGAQERGNVANVSGGHGGPRDVSDDVREIHGQFERSSDSAKEVSKMLEAGKRPYHQKRNVYKVLPSFGASPHLSASNRDQPSSSSENVGPSFLAFDEDIGMSSGNLSSTLQKLYIWEKKLYEEVKSEEKMSIIHERKRQRLKKLDERGAESHEVHATRTLVRSLSAKIRIAMQVVDSISKKINKIRDEELQPQITELIKGLIRMWKVMLECHQNQCMVIGQAKTLDLIGRKLSNSNIEAAMQLELELLNWCSSFNTWIITQKDFVGALNSWLIKCLLYEPEETPDGPIPFSPGRLGAPRVFIVCHDWCQAIRRISEKEVVDAIRAFTQSVQELRERQGAEQQQVLRAGDVTKGSGKGPLDYQKEEKKILKARDTLNKKLTLVSGATFDMGQTKQGLLVQPSASLSSAQLGLKQIFEAMVTFTSVSVKAYEELRIDEKDKQAQENGNVS
ncbi:uncharacterized protein LOC18424301 [Amborella trichopoda]|nr:uncharacterized protein LOC18424301 [Amborella trichopoda]|eukprot:XP_011628968.1 uncharacterized protein LOC18424301 [Amborella trichopoda]